MRGKVGCAFVFKAWRGITPAYAGKSLCSLPQRVHRIGSPPPMRGKVVDFDHVIAENRITPAYAGKSESRMKLLPGSGDHPRLCGEKG